MATSRFNVIVRSFSSAVVQRQMVTPPIQLYGIEGRYATALYSAASKLKQLDSVETELVKFQVQMKVDAKLREFFDDPTLKRSLKVEALKQVSNKFPLSSPSANLMGLLAENGRLQIVNGIINAFKTIMAAHRGEVICEVVTAKTMDEPMKKDLEASLKSFLKPNQTLILNIRVNPALIGGMVVSIGDKYCDMSIATKIKKYTDIITAPV